MDSLNQVGLHTEALVARFRAEGSTKQTGAEGALAHTSVSDPLGPCRDLGSVRIGCGERCPERLCCGTDQPGDSGSWYRPESRDSWVHRFITRGDSSQNLRYSDEIFRFLLRVESVSACGTADRRFHVVDSGCDRRGLFRGQRLPRRYHKAQRNHATDYRSDVQADAGISQ